MFFFVRWVIYANTTYILQQKKLGICQNMEFGQSRKPYHTQPPRPIDFWATASYRDIGPPPHQPPPDFCPIESSVYRCLLGRN